MRVLSLDQASRTSGYAIFDNNELYASGTFSTKHQDLGNRLYDIKTKIRDLINVFKIDYVVFEDIQLQQNKGNNVETFKILAEVIGVISELLYELNIPYQAVLSSVWRSKLGIKGRTREIQKQAAKNYVFLNTHKEVESDEADAICIGLYYIQ